MTRTVLRDALEVELVPILSDNYVYIVKDLETAEIGVVDPGDAASVEAALKARGETPNWILLTHHHDDHIAGAQRLAHTYGAKIAGAKADAHRLPPLDVALEADNDWDFGGQLVEIIDTPGHTIGHISFHFPKAKALFCGDTLFVLGCGRLFEGAPAQMWSSLKKLSALPPETSFFCGHEYTLSNAQFALSLEPKNAALQDRAAEIQALRAAGKPTSPSTIGQELATNPFMRANQPRLKNALGLPEVDDAAVFAEIRRRKDAS